MNRPWIPVVLAAVLTVATAAPASADDAPRDAALRLDAATERLDRTIARVEEALDPHWEPLLVAAATAANLRRIEQALDRARHDAVAAADLLGNGVAPSEVPAALLDRFTDPSTGRLDARTLSSVLFAWAGLQERIDHSRLLRGVLADRLGMRMCPLEDPEEYADDWGDPRGWRSHRGNDINAPEGTPLLAMEGGVVIQMGWHWLGGDGLYLRGARTGDVYYYAHLSGYAGDVRVGTRVHAGQVVGYVGDSGNADVPHLHLGWMPGAGVVDLDALADAYPMLLDLCG